MTCRLENSLFKTYKDFIKDHLRMFMHIYITNCRINKIFASFCKRSFLLRDLINILLFFFLLRFAMKLIEISEESANEISILKKLNHIHILKYVHHFVYKSNYCIITEHCEVSCIKNNSELVVVVGLHTFRPRFAGYCDHQSRDFRLPITLAGEARKSY